MEETVHYYGARRYCAQMINISYFYDLLESTGNRRQLSTCGFIFRAHDGAHCFTLNANFGLSDWS